MAGVSLVNQILWGMQFITVAAMAVLILRMLKERLYRSYRFFFAYLLWDTARTAATLAMNQRTSMYAYVYMLTEVVCWVFYFLMIREIYTAVLENHKGIAAFGKNTLLIGLLLAGTMAVLTLPPDVSQKIQLYRYLQIYLWVNRAVLTTLLFFLMIITSLLVWYPVRVSRNSVFYCIGYATFFLTKVIALLVRNVLGPSATSWINLVSMVVFSLCLFAWILALSRSGEAAHVAIGHGWNPSEAEMLMAQLNSINKTLSRTRNS